MPIPTAELALKPCPWCGAKATFVQLPDTHLWAAETGCDCDILSGFPRKCELAEWWNNRSNDRDVRRKALVDAAKALEGVRSRWVNERLPQGASCRMWQRCVTAIAKLDAEVKHGG